MTARYLYFRPDNDDPSPSPYHPTKCENLFPLGTYCLDTRHGWTWELVELGVNNQEFLMLHYGADKITPPKLKAYALLKGITI